MSASQSTYRCYEKYIFVFAAYGMVWLVDVCVYEIWSIFLTTTLALAIDLVLENIFSKIKFKTTCRAVFEIGYPYRKQVELF